jgi:hypothetical protein
MPNPNQRAGREWEESCARLFRERGFPDTERIVVRPAPAATDPGAQAAALLDHDQPPLVTYAMRCRCDCPECEWLREAVAVLRAVAR